MQIFQQERVRLTPEQIEIAIAHWDKLADDEAARVALNNGRDGLQAKVDLYRRTAESFRIEQRTGVAVCVCCHKPLHADGSHP